MYKCKVPLLTLYYIHTPRLYHLALALDHCCNIIEIFCPCSAKELAHLVQFLFKGEMDCENEGEALLVLENLEKIFGYPEKLDMNHPNKVFEVKLIEERFGFKFKPMNYYVESQTALYSTATLI